MNSNPALALRARMNHGARRTLNLRRRPDEPVIEGTHSRNDFSKMCQNQTPAARTGSRCPCSGQGVAAASPSKRSGVDIAAKSCGNRNGSCRRRRSNETRIIQFPIVRGTDLPSVPIVNA